MTSRTGNELQSIIRHWGESQNTLHTEKKLYRMEDYALVGLPTFYSFYNILVIFVRLPGDQIDTCFFTNFSLAWSATSRSALMLHFTVRSDLCSDMPVTA